MKKKYVITFLLTLMGVFASISLHADNQQPANRADYINVSTASQNALEFLNEMQAVGHHSMRKAPMKPTDLTLCAERSNMYIFNVGKSEGFVVASASSLARPVLCYSTEGQWDEAAMQQSLGWLFEQYEAEMAHARQTSAKAPSKVAAISKSPIEPLVKTLWNQHNPYNDKLTEFEFGGQTYKTPTGCVATAMAQIMNYHQWPKTIKKKIPGYNHGQLLGDNATEVVMKDVPAGTIIDWEHMNKKQITGYKEPEAVEAVSNLMLYCGTAVRMYYSEFTSSSHNLSAMYALKTYFDYDPTMYYAERGNYTYYDWCNLLYNELRAGRPILYNGQSNYGGHSFIVDGYDGNEMFHFNLGWDAATSRTSVYAILSSVAHDSSANNPDAYDSPDGYVYHQSAVINVQKAGLSKGIYHVSLTSESYYNSDPESVNCTYFNNEDEPYTFDLGIGYRDDKGNIQVAKAVERVSIEAVSANSQTFLASGLKLPQGTHRLLPVARLSGGKSDWQFVCNELDYQLATVSASGKVSLSEHKRLAKLSATDITFSGYPYAGQELYVFCNFKNTGEEDYFDKLYFFWNDNPANKGIDAGHYLLWSHATVNAGGNAPVEFYFTPERAGDYTVWITTDPAGENVVGQAKVSVGDKMTFKADSSVPVTISNVKVANLQNGVILGNDVTVDFDVTNPSKTDYFDGWLTMRLHYYFQGNRMGEEGPGTFPEYYQIAPGKSRHFQFTIRDSKPEYNVRFVLYTGSWSPNYYSDGYLVQQAAELYTPSGVKTVLKPDATLTIPESAAAVDLTTVAKKVKKVVPNSNPNTIYYLNQGDALPEGLSGRNVVLGEQAEKIVIDGAYGIAVPKQFTARTASFTKQLKKEKWTTLCLPFSSSISNNQVELAAVTNEDGTHIYTNMAKGFAAYQTCFIRSKKEGAQTLSGSNVTFPKQTHGISTLNNYKSQGVMGKTTVKNVYVLNDEGTAFSLKSSVEVLPFTSFFMISKRGYSPASTVSFSYDGSREAEGITAIDTPEAQDSQLIPAQWYTLEGQKLNGVPTRKGIYLRNGKKVMVK